MIYLIYGDDRNKVLERSKEIAGDLPYKLSGEDVFLAKLEEFVGGRSLFDKKIVVLCDGLFANLEVFNFISKKVQEISDSKNLFIFREGALTKKQLEVFKDSSIKSEEFNLGAKLPSSRRGYAGAREVKLKVGYEDFNIFNFTDALGERDRKLSWVIFHKALRAGISAEELFWKAVWLFRNIILASPLNSDQDGLATRLKISPFVIKKSKSFLKNYTTEALQEDYRKLVRIYHEFRRGAVEADLAIEQFILNL